MDDKPVQVLDRLLRSGCRSTGLDGAGVSIASSSGMHEPLYASDSVACEIERLQLTLGEGPCIEASATGAPVLATDLTDSRDEESRRWPIFRNEAVRIGARAIFAFPIRIGATYLGNSRPVPRDGRPAEPAGARPCVVLDGRGGSGCARGARLLR